MLVGAESKRMDVCGGYLRVKTPSWGLVTARLKSRPPGSGGNRSGRGYVKLLRISDDET